MRATVILIDGNQLADYIYDYGQEMQTTQTIELKKLDPDFWDAMKDAWAYKSLSLVLNTFKHLVFSNQNHPQLHPKTAKFMFINQKYVPLLLGEVSWGCLGEK